jgi:hypothetical protein
MALSTAGEITDKGALYAHQLDQLSKSGQMPF